MAANAGALVVSIGLDAAEYTRGLSRAESEAKRFSEGLGRGLESAAALGVAGLATVGTAAVAAFAGLDKLIKIAADFQDFSDETGASAEGLASFALAAGTAGVSMESVAGSMNKLSKVLTGVDDESKAAGAALAAMGLQVEEIKKLDPTARYEAIGKALSGYADGAGKTAAVLALLGKEGAQQLKVFKALDDQGGRTVILTGEQTAAADAYADSQAKLQTQIKLYSASIATEALPAITAMTSVLADMAKEQAFATTASDALKVGMDSLTTVFQTLTVLGSNVGFVFLGVGREIGALAAQAAALANLDIKGFRAISDAVKEDGERARKELDKLTARVMGIGQPVTPTRRLLRDPGTPADQLIPKNQLNYNGASKAGAKGRAGGAGAADDPTKKLLENALKFQENAAKEEEEILRSRNRMLDLYNGENLISTKDYFAGKQAAQDLAVGAQIAAYDKEIEALRAYQAKVGKATEREAAEGKINDLLAKKVTLTRDAAQAATEMGFAQRRANEGYAETIQGLNARVLELSGNLAAAASIRLDAQLKDITALAKLNGNAEDLAIIESFRKKEQAQIQFSAAAEKAQEIQSRLRLEEERIQLDRELGIVTEIESLRKLGDARASASGQLAQYVEAQRSAAALGDSPKLAIGAEQTALEARRLQANSDPMAGKINTLFQDNVASGLGDIVTGAKSAKNAFKDMEKSIVDGISRMAMESLTQNIFKNLFSGGGFDIGKSLSGLFGGNSGGGGGGGFASMLSGLFGFAGGGNVSPGQMVRVNENSPELFDYQGKQYLMNGNKNGRVIPNGGGGGSMVVHNNFTIQGTADRGTQMQIAARAGQGVRSALARNT